MGRVATGPAERVKCLPFFTAWCDTLARAKILIMHANDSSRVRMGDACMHVRVLQGGTEKFITLRWNFAFGVIF